MPPAQYYLDESLGGRHELKFGFDHAHAPVENRVTRFDDVDLTYSSATGLSQIVDPVRDAVLLEDRLWT